MYLFDIVVQQLGTALAKSFPSLNSELVAGGFLPHGHRFHGIHGTGIFTYIWSIFDGTCMMYSYINVSYTDPMGFEATKKGTRIFPELENSKIQRLFCHSISRVPNISQKNTFQFLLIFFRIKKIVFHNLIMLKKTWFRCFSCFPIKIEASKL